MAKLPSSIFLNGDVIVDSFVNVYGEKEEQWFGADWDTRDDADEVAGGEALYRIHVIPKGKKP